MAASCTMKSKCFMVIFRFSSLRVIWRHQTDYDVIKVKIDQNQKKNFGTSSRQAEFYRMSHRWRKSGNIRSILGVLVAAIPLGKRGLKKSWLTGRFLKIMIFEVLTFQNFENSPKIQFLEFFNEICFYLFYITPAIRKCNKPDFEKC